jgi:hypothetical protein
MQGCRSCACVLHLTQRVWWAAIWKRLSAGVDASGGAVWWVWRGGVVWSAAGRGQGVQCACLANASIDRSSSGLMQE